MAETEKEAYLALIAERDPEIRTLLDQGFEFVTNAWKSAPRMTSRAILVQLSAPFGGRRHRGRLQRRRADHVHHEPGQPKKGT